MAFHNSQNTSSPHTSHLQITVIRRRDARRATLPAKIDAEEPADAGQRQRVAVGAWAGPGIQGAAGADERGGAPLGP